MTKIVAALDDDGALLEPHPDFRDEFVGSYTLWPHKPVGERLGFAHWMGAQQGWPFDGPPRSWADAKGLSHHRKPIDA